jgi:hypothetical protein
MHAAAFIQLLPPLIAVIGHRMTTPPRRWVVAWCLVLALQDALSVLATLRWGNNLFVSHIFLPVTSAIALSALSLWQTGPTSRLAMRLAIPGVVTVSLLLSLLADHPDTFALFTAPYHAVVMLIATSWTFVRSSLMEDGSLLEHDWFWIAGGMLLYFGAFTAIHPLLSYFYASGRNDLIVAAFDTRAAMTIVAFLAVTGGLLCPAPLMRSGGPFSPPSSPSPSSSPLSAPRW